MLFEEGRELRAPLRPREDEPVVVAAAHFEEGLRLVRPFEQLAPVGVRDDVVVAAVRDEYRRLDPFQVFRIVVAQAADQAARAATTT